MATEQNTLPEDFDSIARAYSELGTAISAAANGRLTNFAPITLRLPVSDPPIHAFYTMVSWLYVTIIESGSVHFRFLSERATALGIDRNGELELFRKDVQVFRTVLQHNLNLSDANDVAKLFRCEAWMAETLKDTISPGGRFWPAHDSQWRILSARMRDRAKSYCEMNLATVKRIVSDEFAEDVICEWVFRESRSLPAHDFDTITGQAAADLGLEHLDSLRIRKTHLDDWNRKLRLISDGADSKREARRLVEQTLLSEANNFLPVTGGDIIEVLGVKPGPQVGKILMKAREVYHNAPCDRDELLKKLRSQM